MKDKDFSLTSAEAELMLEVYGGYIKDFLEDIYTPSIQDLGLLVKIAGSENNIWYNSNLKTQEGFNNRLNFLNETYRDYQEFRNILLKSGESPFACRDKAMEFIRRN